MSQEDWRIHENREILEILQEEDIAKLNHRVPDGTDMTSEWETQPHKIMTAQKHATQRHWQYQVLGDLKVAKVTRWIATVLVRCIWRRVVY